MVVLKQTGTHSNVRSLVQVGCLVIQAPVPHWELIRREGAWPGHCEHLGGEEKEGTFPGTRTTVSGTSCSWASPSRRLITCKL